MEQFPEYEVKVISFSSCKYLQVIFWRSTILHCRKLLVLYIDESSIVRSFRFSASVQFCTSELMLTCLPSKLHKINISIEC
jgi:hypothetical protein